MSNNKPQIEKESELEVLTQVKREHEIILYNDDVNTFDYVMDTLVEVCDHSLTQAEQCATITHYKGKCEVRTGTFAEMKELRFELISRGLKASVDN